METTSPSRIAAAVQATKPDNPVVAFVEGVETAMLEVWRKETGTDPPDGCTAFEVACWRVVSFLVGFKAQPQYQIDEVEISCHARTWAQPRMEWDVPPLLLCDYARAEPKGRWLFWLVVRDAAES